jgi:hypothetical protein
MSIFCATTERTGSTVVKVTFKNTKTKKSTAKKFRCVVKAAAEQTPETPETPVVTEAVKVTAATQKQGNTIEVTMSSAVTSAAVADFSIVRDSTAAPVAINTVTVDSTDGTKVTIKTFEELLDAEAYTVTYTASDDAKTQSTAQFTATDNQIADLNVTPLTVIAGKTTTIKYQTLDKNGVILTERSIGNPASNIVVDAVQINSTGTYTEAGNLNLPNVGDTATVTVTYHTYKYDTTTNQETGAITKSFTVTAVDGTEAASVEYTVAKSRPNWATVKKTSQLGETDGSTYSAWIHITDAEGDSLSDAQLREYSVESSNSSVLLASGTCDGAINLQVVNQGSANLVVSKDGQVKYTLPITVGAARYLANVQLSDSSVSITKDVENLGTNHAMNGAQVEATAVDQYGARYTNVSFDKNATIMNGTTSSKNIFDETTSSWSVNGKSVIEVSTGGGVAVAGTTYCTLAFQDTANGKTAYASLRVTVVDDNTISNYALKAVLSESEKYAGAAASASTGGAITKVFDTTYKSGDNATMSAIIRMVGINSSLTVANVTKADTVSVTGIKVVGPNNVVYAQASGANSTPTVTVSSTAITAGALKRVLTTSGSAALVVKLRGKTTATQVEKYLPAGTYTVTYSVTSSSNSTLKTVQETFTVKDDLNISAKINATSVGSRTIREALDLAEYVTYTNQTTSSVYTVGESAGLSVKEVFGSTSGGTTAYVTGILATVGTSNEQVYIPINATFYGNNSGCFTGIVLANDRVAAKMGVLE